MEDEEIERYARHLVLKEIGGPGQQRLKASHIVIIGAGGLGGPAALYLAAAGIGRITLIDPDVVSLDNLQRQIQFTTADIGQPKAAAAGDHLSNLNPHGKIISVREAIDAENAGHWLADADIVLDGCDNFETRFAVNAACHVLGKPLVSGAVGRWSGQVGLFASGTDRNQPCYQCFVPAMPPDAETCERVGVVGALTGIAGSMMALEAIKWITGAGTPLTGRLWLYDGLAGTSRTLKITKDPACPVCG
ncbi:HesA/MoeB/ThiF family protein [Hyphobacterium sp. HN65]|uniref:HesA/MoeB/ThiF family protein n=1 Tax=Hyphobacterium lacteum TaxID=3116575 RepID=A0ABU7LS45_9PROT|nr:HesA/MoeB/ThiF family protein [Hyphobacterium sp. HN65]MEE2526718.1 HesA/MoeB/ThiF family protein [Hyphobacterium sp. HN65]